MKLECKQCGGAMIKKTLGRGNCFGLILALSLVLIGIVLSFFVPIGTIIGIVLIIVGLFTGGKSRKVWRCKSCGTIIERA